MKNIIIRTKAVREPFRYWRVKGDFNSFYDLVSSFVNEKFSKNGENYIARELHYRFKSNYPLFKDKIVETAPFEVIEYIDWSEWAFQNENFNSKRQLPRKVYTRQ